MTKATRSCMVLALAAAACTRGGEAAKEADTPTLLTLGAEVGFKTPESVLHDTAADVYLVSNVNGGLTDHDDNGFISRVTPKGEVVALRWIDGASPDVTLNGPKGTAIRGDTLFVADIDAVRLFDRRSGAALGEWAVPGSTFLNDLTVGPDGTLYLSDSGLKPGPNGLEPTGTDAVYRFTGSTPVAIVSGATLGQPNGLVADSAGLVVVTFTSGEVFRLDPATGARTDLPKPEKGGLDGVVEGRDGSLGIASWGAQTVYRLTPAGLYQSVTETIGSPADIGLDLRRGVLLVPDLLTDRVLFRPLRPLQ